MPRNFFKEKGFSSDDSPLGSGSKPVEVAATVISLPTGILYRKNCEGSLKTVLDCLSMIDDHFLINAKLDVANIYSESKNLAISIASTGKVTIADIIQTNITAADAAGVTVTDSSGDTALIIGESTGAIKVQSIYPLDAITELQLYNCNGDLCLETAGTTPGAITTPYINAPNMESTGDLTLTCASSYSIIFDDNAPDSSVGTLHMLLEEDRPSTWVLAAGTATTFTDVSFSAYVPTGVKALLLTIATIFTGNGVGDYVVINIRRNGSSETADARTRASSSEYLNLPTNTLLNNTTQKTVLCDSNGVIEYKLTGGPGSVYMNIDGYYY